LKITLLPSSTGPAGAAERFQFLTSFLINDTVAIDAGSIGFFQGPRDQALVKHIFLSHTHIDHIASLPIFLENVYEGKTDCVTVYGSDSVLECLQKDVFNDRVWADFIGLSRTQAPFLKLERLSPGTPLEVESLRITPVRVDHTVPTLGFLVEDGQATVIIPGDTGPTEEIWQRANAAANLKAVFLEASFPDEMAGLAEASKHLTPATFHRELQKLRGPLAVIAVHIKPRYRETILEQLQRLNLTDLRIGEHCTPYIF
jgi:ribonuclease BN (tRNA processing enzyme)